MNLTKGWVADALFKGIISLFKCFFFNLYIRRVKKFDDEDLHVDCKSTFEEPEIGSRMRLRKWQCTPNFYERIKKEVVKRNAMPANAMNDISSIDFIMRRRLNEFGHHYQVKYDQLMAAANRALQKSPALQQRNEEFKNAVLAYKKAHIKKFGKMSTYYAELNP